LSFEGFFYLLGALGGIIIARLYGVEFRGLLAEYRLYGGVLFAIFFSGYKLNLLSKFNSKNYIELLNLNTYSVLLLSILIFFPLLIIGYFSGYDFILIVAVIFHATLFCIIDYNHALITSMRKIKYAYVLLIFPIFLYVITIFLFKNFLDKNPILVYILPFLYQGIIIFFIASYKNFLKKIQIKKLGLNIKNAFSYVPYYGTIAVVSYLPGLFLINDTAQLAFFSVAHSLTIPLLKIPRIVGNFSFFDFKRTDEKVFDRFVLYTLIIMILLAFTFFFISDYIIILLFSEKFALSSVPFKILVLSLPLTLLISRMESKFFTEDKKNISVIVVLLSLSVFIPLFFKQNLNAVTISIFFSIYRLIMTMLFLIFTIRTFKIKFNF
tara:strand:+ start:8853 stop:9995 length:1143 start_codon:yes stop_codon:yes gene_type:complete